MSENIDNDDILNNNNNNNENIDDYVDDDDDDMIVKKNNNNTNDDDDLKDSDDDGNIKNEKRSNKRSRVVDDDDDNNNNDNNNNDEDEFAGLPEDEDEAEDSEDEDNDDENNNDEEENDGDNDTAAKVKSKSKLKARRFEDDEDDNINDDDDDDIFDKKKKKKSEKKKKKKEKSKVKRRRVADYFDELADEGGGSDDEDEYEYEKREATVEQLNEEEKEARARVERRHEIRRKELATSAQDLAAEYERKAAEDRRRRQYASDFQEQGTGVVGKARTNTVQEGRLLPSIHDPSIWRVKCTPGMEKQLVRSILYKCFASKRTNTPIKICSAFTSQAKATIYIEALAEPFAKEAIAGIRGLYSNSFVKVPVGEMTSLVNITVVKQPLKVGQWARMRRGPLTKDLVQIQAIMEGDTRAIVKAVPRPDYTSAFGSKGKGVKGSRPPQRLLDLEEAKNAGGFVDRRYMPGTNHTDLQGTFFDYWNNDYYMDGYLYKDVNVTSYLKADDVNPRLEELQLFREKKNKKKDKKRYDDDDDDDDDEEETHNESVLNELAEQMSKSISSDSKNKVAPFVPGDIVQITSGESRNLIGRITAVNEVSQTATVMPYSNVITVPLEVEMKILTKYIYPGAHVKVVAGVHMGQTGRVVSLTNKDDDLLAIIITDGVNTEIMIKTSTLQITNEVSTGLGNLMGYELYDLVSLNDNEVAIVLKVGAEKLFVMNHLGTTKYVLPLELQGKRNTQSQRSKAFDNENSQIVVGDSVKLKSSDDGFVGLGTVKHIHKGILWIHSNTYLKNSGVCVTRGKNCIVAGNKAAANKLSLYPSTNNSMGPPSRPPTKSFRNERSHDIGKTVRITKGKCKGLIAQIYGINGDNYLVELLAKLQKMTVPKANCTICGDKNGSIEGRNNTNTRNNNDIDIGTPFMGHMTPMYGAETPRNWGITPLHTPSYTPSHSGETSDYFKITDRDKEYLEDPVNDKDPWAIDSSVGPSPSINSGSNYNLNSDRSNYTNNFSAGSNSAYMSESQRSEYSIEGRSKTSSKDWIENMILAVKAGRMMGKAVVLLQKPNDRGDARVQIIDSSGRLEPGTHMIHSNDLSAAEPRKGDKVCFLTGKKRGQIGEFKGFAKSDAVVTLDGKDTLHKVEILAAMFK